MFISYAHAAADAPQGGGLQTLIMLGGFAVIFYFMILRPQKKREKEHKSLVENLAKGDEVLTTGGLVGKITKVSSEDDYVVLSLSENTEVTIKKDFVTALLPKGSSKSL